MLSAGKLTPISQCIRSLDFGPRLSWPQALPPIAWKGILLHGFDRTSGAALDIGVDSMTNWQEAFVACHPRLGLAELSRLHSCMKAELPELLTEAAALFQRYGLRWSDRLQQILFVLRQMPLEFQDWVDEKGVGARDLAPLLAVPDLQTIQPHLRNLVRLAGTKSQILQVLECSIELSLLGQSLATLELQPGEDISAYKFRLESIRRPLNSKRDETWRSMVATWAWTNQVQGQWQRFGDQAGLEIKLQAFSPDDLLKKIQRLKVIGETWEQST